MMAEAEEFTATLPMAGLVLSSVRRNQRRKRTARKISRLIYEHSATWKRERARVCVSAGVCAQLCIPVSESTTYVYACEWYHNKFKRHANYSSMDVCIAVVNKLCARPPRYAPALWKLTFDLLTLKVVSESCVTWDTSVPILVLLGLSVLDLGPVRDRQTSSDKSIA